MCGVCARIRSCKPLSESVSRLVSSGLTFHDLRHEATSRLFKKELEPYTGDDDHGPLTLQMLKRYTQLRAEDLVGMLG